MKSYRMAIMVKGTQFRHKIVSEEAMDDINTKTTTRVFHGKYHLLVETELLRAALFSRLVVKKVSSHVGVKVFKVKVKKVI